MAHPIADFGPVKKLIAWAERAAKQGLIILPEGADDLQASIDDPAQMKRIVRYIQTGAPDLRIVPNAQVILPFEEPDSHRRARQIMGANFLGIEGAQRTFGAYTPEQLAARIELPFSEETLRVCAEDFILLCTHPLDIMSVHAVHPERFTSDPDDPWFGRSGEREKWSSQLISEPWLLVRKNIVPQSTCKNVDAQGEHLRKKFPQERMLLTCEFTYAALRLFLETGQKLCEGYVVRFLVQTVDGRWLGVEWDGDQLGVSSWGGRARGNIGSSSARTS